jgi:hypothetical protein
MLLPTQWVNWALGPPGGGYLHGHEAEPRGPCPLYPDSAGFVMNSLEEGVLGVPVLAGNLVLNPNGKKVTADGPPVVNTPPGRLEWHRLQAL